MVRPSHRAQRDLRSHTTVTGTHYMRVKIPWTKTKQRAGETTGAVERRGWSTCPIAAMRRHLDKTPGQASDTLYSYIDKKGKRQHMVKTAMTDRINGILLRAHQRPMKGHCIRIGGCTELLLQGVARKDVKTIGRWASDGAFELYVRRHECLIVPALLETARRVGPEVKASVQLMGGRSTGPSTGTSRGASDGWSLDRSSLSTHERLR